MAYQLIFLLPPDIFLLRFRSTYQRLVMDWDEKTLSNGITLRNYLTIGRHGNHLVPDTMPHKYRIYRKT